MNSKDDTLVTVYYSQGPLAAEVAKSKLEANGISAILRYASVGRVFALTVDGLGLVEVLVHPGDAQQAREILANAGSAVGGDDSLGQGD